MSSYNEQKNHRLYLHVVFAIDRAGIVGEDGETHHGIYDISFLSHIPNMTILAPCDYNDFAKMLKYALEEHKGPVAIRYPRGKGSDKLVETPPVIYGQSLLLRKGTDVTIAAVGNKVETALLVADMLGKMNFTCDVIYSRFIKPIDEKLLLNSAGKTRLVVTIEDNALAGGFGSKVLETMSRRGINIKSKMFGYPDQFISHGLTNELQSIYKLDAQSIVKEVSAGLLK